MAASRKVDLFIALRDDDAVTLHAGLHGRSAAAVVKARNAELVARD
jgi:hypothetical protein